MTAAAEFRHALTAGNARRMCDVWRAAYPGMPAPESVEQGEIVMHRARTEARFLDVARRVYSHRWLTERGFPSGLPSDLVPKPERIASVPVYGIGVSVNTPPSRSALGREIHDAMRDIGADMLVDGQDHLRIRHEMQHARQAVIKRMGG